MIFNEETHEYIEGGQAYISVTQLLKKYGLSADYAGIPNKVLQAAAVRGKQMHKDLELFINGDTSQLKTSRDVALFNKYITDNNIDLSSAKSEQIFYDTIYKLAGTIDFTYYDKNDIVIADFKRTSQLHLDVVAWQLSLYNYLFVKGDPLNYYFNKLKVYHFINGKLHVIDVQTINYDQVKNLLDAQLNDLPTFVYTKNTNVISDTDILRLSGLNKELRTYQAIVDTLIDQRNTILNDVKTEMIKQKEYFFKSDDFDITYVAAQTRRSFNTSAAKQFIEQHGGDVETFMRETTTDDNILLIDKVDRNEISLNARRKTKRKVGA